MREYVYLVVQAFAARGEWLGVEAQHYANHLVREFERVTTRIVELCNGACMLVWP